MHINACARIVECWCRLVWLRLLTAMTFNDFYTHFYSFFIPPLFPWTHSQFYEKLADSTEGRDRWHLMRQALSSQNGRKCLLLLCAFALPLGISCCAVAKRVMVCWSVHRWAVGSLGNTAQATATKLFFEPSRPSGTMPRRLGAWCWGLWNVG